VRQLSYYIDTSVWNFLLEHDRPERQQATARFFQQVGSQGGLAISEVVTREIERAPVQRRVALEQLLKQYQPEILDVTAEVDTLAQRYITERLIPPRYRDDALHLATAVVHERDLLVSWNFDHLVKLKTRVGVNAVNKLVGYREIEIVSPEEVDVT